MAKLTKKEALKINMPLYMETLDGNPYRVNVVAVVIPHDPPQVVIDIIYSEKGTIYTMEEYLARRSLMYPGLSFKDLEKELEQNLIDCTEHDLA